LPHLIISAIEHPSVLAAAEQLEKFGAAVTKLPVNNLGLVEPESLEAAIRPETCFISVMLANNEIGTIQPVKQLAKIAKKHSVAFHTDAVQAAGILKLDVRDLGVDLLSISAHKFYGPKGVGALYIRDGLKPRPEPLIGGGLQEREMRGGTTNVPGVIGMAAALKETRADLEKNYAHLEELRGYFMNKIFSEIPGAPYNGCYENYLPQIINCSFPGALAGELVHLLDLAGVACASGSACSSGSTEPSHVLLALGISNEEAKSAIRFSLGKFTTRDDLDFAVTQIKKTVEKFRKNAHAFKEIKTKTKKV
jgi:cysteine desulfurase